MKFNNKVETLSYTFERITGKLWLSVYNIIERT